MTGRVKTMPDHELLAVLHSVMIDHVRSDVRDLTARQLAALLVIYSFPDDRHTIRSLATEMEVNKPSISRVIDVLEECGLAKRVPDPRDGRSILVERTRRGIQLFKGIRACAYSAAKKLKPARPELLVANSMQRRAS